MPITLNKNFKKSQEVPSKTKKAQDETVQITRKEWESMQESLAQLQGFMNDLVEGNLEIEIVDEGETEPKEPKEVKGIETEEVKTEEPKEEEPKKEDEKEPKAEDADIEEVLKDPNKRKAVLEFLKATDSKYPVKGIDEKQLRKKIDLAVKEAGFKKGLKNKAGDSISKTPIIDYVTKRIGDGSLDSHEKIADAVIKSFKYQYATTKKATDKKVEPVKKEPTKTKETLKRKTIKKSMDKAIPDFTSRFEDTPVKKVKAVDNKDLSKEFSNRFN